MECCPGQAGAPTLPAIQNQAPHPCEYANLGSSPAPGAIFSHERSPTMGCSAGDNESPMTVCLLGRRKFVVIAEVGFQAEGVGGLRVARHQLVLVVLEVEIKRVLR